jgi:thioredoxin 1
MVIVKRYTASWCGPCKMIAPLFEEFKKKYFETGVNFVTVDVDDNQEEARQDMITSVPCVIFIKNGAEVSRVVGAKPKYEYEKIIQSLV